jgi:serine/threonine-protein kinase RsbW
MKDKVCLSIPTKSEYVSVARLTSSVIANNMGFDIEDIEDIKVAVGEACNNAVLHTNDKDHTFDLSFLAETEKLIIEVKDAGKGFSLDKYEEPDLEHPKEHGLGIFIMKSLMDDLEIDSEIGVGTSIRMTKYLNK